MILSDGTLQNTGQHPCKGAIRVSTCLDARCHCKKEDIGKYKGKFGRSAAGSQEQLELLKQCASDVAKPMQAMLLLLLLRRWRLRLLLLLTPPPAQYRIAQADGSLNWSKLVLYFGLAFVLVNWHESGQIFYVLVFSYLGQTTRFSSSTSAIMKGAPKTVAGMHNHCDPWSGGGKFAPLNYLAAWVLGRDTEHFADVPAMDLPPAGKGCTWFGLKRTHLLRYRTTPNGIPAEVISAVDREVISVLSFFLFEIAVLWSVHYFVNKRRLKQIRRQEERASAAPPVS